MSLDNQLLGCISFLPVASSRGLYRVYILVHLGLYLAAGVCAS